MLQFPVPTIRWQQLPPELGAEDEVPSEGATERAAQTGRGTQSRGLHGRAGEEQQRRVRDPPAEARELAAEGKGQYLLGVLSLE